MIERGFTFYLFLFFEEVWDSLNKGYVDNKVSIMIV